MKAGKFAVGILLPRAKTTTDFLICEIPFTYPVSLDFFF